MRPKRRAGFHLPLLWVVANALEKRADFIRPYIGLWLIRPKNGQVLPAPTVYPTILSTSQLPLRLSFVRRATFVGRVRSRFGCG